MFNKKLSFIYLSAFASEGGIEKFNRSLIKSLNESVGLLWLYSLYDRPGQLKLNYLSNLARFQSRGKGKVAESLSILKELSFRPDAINIWGHINLAPLLILTDLLNRKGKQVLIAHGVEVWEELSWVKKRMLRSVDEIWAVSEYTKGKLVERYPDLKGKVRVFHNTLDPYFAGVRSTSFTKATEGAKTESCLSADRQDISNPNVNIRKKYNLDADTPILYTLCRLSSEEGYKGYDQVLRAMALMEGEKPYYLIAGKYDEGEKNRIEGLAQELGLSDRLVLAGFLKDEEMIPHYRQADLFIMPSRGEGFGIVFLEAMAAGLPVIAGNQDGSVDALQNGKLGTLVDSTDSAAIANAIVADLKTHARKKKPPLYESIQKVEAIFGFEIFKSRLQRYLSDLAEK